MAQLTFSDVEMGMGRKRETRRSRFLDRLSESCPWDAWLALVREARKADAGARGADPAMGRPRVDDLVLLRMYMVQVCFGLSDRECEDQVWDSATMRSFVGVAPFEVPDATTLCKFRHLLERRGVGRAMVSSAFGSAAEGGLAVSRGTIVDATFIESPSSTRNADGARDPDAHQAKKGQNWHFGYKLGVGVDAETGVPHSARMDAANVHDLDQVPDLVREGDERVWADAGYVDRIVLTIIAVSLVGALINRFAQKYARTLGESVFADLRERMMNRVVHLPLSAVESAGTGDLVGRTTNDVSRIEFLVRVGVPQIMVCTVTIVFTIVAAAVSDPVLAAGLLVVVPPVWAMMSWYLPISVPAYRAESAAHARLNGAVTETVENAETVDALGIGRRREAVIADRVAQAWGLERYTAGLRLRLFLVLDVAWRSPVVVILIWGGFLAARGHATLGAITTVSLYAMELRKPIAQLMFWIDLVQVSQASLTRILGVEEVRDDRTPTGAVPDGTRMALRGVRFSYRQGVEVLHGIDLDLVPGERLAVVGPSGSGKSTLGRMLAGINPPTSGSVTVGGVPLTDLSEAELRQHVALVTQEHHVFVGTIADNVRLGRPDADDGTIRRAIEAIGANSWVDALGEGMRTMVGSGHLTLSPAQAQEVALARLVLLDPHTLILDEATSLLDPRSARALERTLSTALAGRTVVEVVHRLYTAQDADRVAVVMDGRIVELGTHEQLVALGGEYASLWEAWSQE